MNRLSAAIVFILTTECGAIKKWERSMHILKEELVVGGGKIGHHESQIASGVTDDQNTIRILIIFWGVREPQCFGVYSLVMSKVPWIYPTWYRENNSYGKMECPKHHWIIHMQGRETCCRWGDQWNGGWIYSIWMESRRTNRVKNRFLKGDTTIKSHHQWLTQDKLGTLCHCNWGERRYIIEENRSEDESVGEWNEKDDED